MAKKKNLFGQKAYTPYKTIGLNWHGQNQN